MAERTVRKLRGDALDSLTMDGLERLLGRLWFAAGVLALAFHLFWWFLKATRRLFSLWTRGLPQGLSPATLPDSAAQQLRAWYDMAVMNKPRRITKLPPSNAVYDIFSDATVMGWGAVCIDRATKRHTVAGSKWHAVSDYISAADTQAVECAFLAFQLYLQPGAQTALFIDNTSALSSVRRGHSQSHAINNELRRSLGQFPYIIDRHYIRSAENQANQPSRAALYQTERVTTRHGVGDTQDFGVGL